MVAAVGLSGAQIIRIFYFSPRPSLLSDGGILGDLLTGWAAIAGLSS